MKIIDLDILSVRAQSFKIKLLFLIVYIKTQSIFLKKNFFYSIVFLPLGFLSKVFILFKPESE